MKVFSKKIVPNKNRFATYASTEKFLVYHFTKGNKTSYFLNALNILILCDVSYTYVFNLSSNFKNKNKTANYCHIDYLVNK